MALAAIFGCSGPDLTPEEAGFFARVRPWGFILFARNITPDGARLSRLVADLRATVPHPVTVFVDQEGGTVQRLRPPLARNWADANAQPGGRSAVRLRHILMAAELRDCGIDGNCAPVVDLGGPGTHPFLKRRIWSSDPGDLAGLAALACEGLMRGGVMPVIKHLPGHGSADADSHHALPVCNLSLDVLRARDFRVVREIPRALAPAGMTAHVLYPALDPGRPATLSPVVLDFLRRDLGYDGLLMTDDICMNALGGGMGERAGAALAAGCDLVLHCSGEMAEMEAVAGAIGPLTPGAEARAEDARRAVAEAGRDFDLARAEGRLAVDLARLNAELEAVETGAVA